jgi:hypothetical protein
MHCPGSPTRLVGAVTLAPEVADRMQAIETHLATLDPIFRDFCNRHNYTFRSSISVRPRRGACRREEVDRCFDLSMELTVPEVMERGFSSSMPWSLCITASTHPIHAIPVCILSAYVFRGLPFSSLGNALAVELEVGLATLRTFTPEAINEGGRSIEQSA